MPVTGIDGNAVVGTVAPQSEPGTVGARWPTPRDHPPRAPARNGRRWSARRSRRRRVPPVIAEDRAGGPRAVTGRETGGKRGGTAGPTPRPGIGWDGAFSMPRRGRGRDEMTKRFESVDAKVSFPELERGILGFWKDRDVFARSLAQREGAPASSSTRAPPRPTACPTSATSSPASSRTSSRATRRCRATASPGRPAGTPTACRSRSRSRRSSASTARRRSRRYGVEPLHRALHRVGPRYVGEWERLTERIGFWVDLADAYLTISTELRRERLVGARSSCTKGPALPGPQGRGGGRRAAPRCPPPRSGSGYRTVDDPSVLRARSRSSRRPTRPGRRSLLVWTTTPWTLPSNICAAVDPDVEYVVVRGDRRAR